MAGRVGNLLCTARAPLKGQVGTLRAFSIVRMTVVRHGSMSALRSLLTLEPALRRACSARLGGLQHSSATGTADILEDGLGTAATDAPVTELLAVMVSTLQRTSAHSETDVLCLNGRGRADESVLLPRRRSLSRLLLARAAVFATTMTSAAHVRLARPEAERVLDLTLMADTRRRDPAAPTGDIHDLIAARTVSQVALSFTQVSTWELLLTWLVAVRDRVLARTPRLRKKGLQWRFAAWAMGNDVG
jgi:hypothetical protein